ncbi:MAG: hypothetical protein LQ344_005939 [Seirophora lacunosa]|nr:MAG: hypothetical protein LQ344_005939 [Seirophora lacunosa]
MRSLVDRLQALSKVIAEICRISGTPDASIGVLHEDKVIYTHNYGYRNVESSIPPDENTIYHIASLSKSFTAASIAILVEVGKLSWDTPVRELLPDFKHVDSTINDEATILDFMSHRTGLAPKNMLWLHEYAGVELRRSETLRMVSYLETVFGFRKQWLYSHWGYAVADQIIQRLSGQSWGAFLAHRLLEPLGLNRTVTEHSSKIDNVARAYMALSDGTPYHLPRPSVEDGVIMEGAVGVQSSVADLLTYSQKVMQAADDQISRNTTSTEGSPLKQVSTLLENHINLSAAPSKLERSYALGWIRTMLPGPLGTVGLNPMYVEAMPLVGKGLKEPRMVYHHQGSLIDYLCSIHLIPSTRTAIVVLTNSMSNNDAADWLGQLLLETVLDNSEPNDYVELARTSVETSNRLWSQMAEELEDARIPDTPVRELSEYVGSYYNVVKDWHMEVWVGEGKLYMCHQDDRKQFYPLEHYNHDTFTWLLTRDQTVRRGLFPVTKTEYYILAFGQGEDGQIDHVLWRHDPSVPEGETFKRLSGSASEKGLPLLASKGKQNVLGAKG